MKSCKVNVGMLQGKRRH